MAPDLESGAMVRKGTVTWIALSLCPVEITVFPFWANDHPKEPVNREIKRIALLKSDFIKYLKNERDKDKLNLQSNG
jgi:hypothetical protein